jgi:diguanylate cyclase (GGDEF)-like protein
LIQDRLQQGLYVAQRDKRPLAIIMIDLDRFKEVNDTLGHNIGDELLKHVSERISNTLRKSDTIGRLGGDEFAVVLPNTDMGGSLITADKILRGLEPAFEIEGHTFSIAASLGIALYPEHGKDRDMLLKCADVAMYIAKRANDGYFVYDPKEDKHTTEHLALMGELRAAISNNELELYYQPKIDLEDGRIIGVEALARWHHPEKGFVPPDVFIPVLEQTGLIKPFTNWALNTALGQCHEWNKAGLDLTMAVNLSMHNLRDPNLPGLLSELLKKWNIKEGALILEITESAVMSNPESVIGILAELKSLGVRFSIDDFGTGHSSLSYLKKLPVSELKIDRSFVMEMNRGKDDAMIVNSTVELAHNLGLRVVAEGVESDDILNSLIALNSDMAQGYFISRPIPPDKLHAFLKTSKWKLTEEKRVNAG